MIVTDYHRKKVVDYLKPGMKVCLKFLHGLGDTFMFYPLFLQLKKLYPEIDFRLYVSFGQEEWFGKESCNESDYDIVFVIHYPCNENEKPLIHTKSSLCCERELGIQYKPEWELSYDVREVKSPLIGIHFNSTCGPKRVGCNEFFGKMIWNKVIENGYIPIETHFEHCYHNPVNVKYDFVTTHVRGCKASIENLIGLLQRCRGFIGVGSGPFCIATQLYPEKVLHLKNKNDVKCYYRTKPVLSMDINKAFDESIFNKWLENIK